VFQAKIFRFHADLNLNSENKTENCFHSQSKFKTMGIFTPNKFQCSEFRVTIFLSFDFFPSKAIIILQMTEFGPLAMQLYDKTIYTYPAGAKAVGWCMALSSVMMVPIIAIKTILGYKGSLSQVETHLKKPSIYKRNLKATF
jgi:hypothetical protein